MAFKQRKRVKNTKNKYLKPGALAQIRYFRTSSKSCTDIGKKRVVVEPEKAKFHVSSTPVMSPIRFIPQPDESKLQKFPLTPKTPQSAGCEGLSSLESLPMDLLVKILCHLHHDQLRPVFHVSQRIRAAVILARQWHFNYTTPDRSRQEMLNTKTPIPTEHWPFMSKSYGRRMWGSGPQAPKAPKHCHRLRPSLIDMKQISAVLFQESAALSPKPAMPAGLPRLPFFKPVSSTRVLFYEDELCKAVAQNKLR